MTYAEKLALAHGDIPPSKVFALIIFFLIWIFFTVSMADELRSALIFTGIVGCVILWCSCLTYSGVHTDDPANTVEHRERVSRYYSQII